MSSVIFPLNSGAMTSLDSLAMSIDGLEHAAVPMITSLGASHPPSLGYSHVLMLSVSTYATALTHVLIRETGAGLPATYAEAARMLT